MGAISDVGTARRCYFCGGSGRMSKEHAWPQWTKAGAEVLPTRTTTKVGFARTAEDTLTESPNLRRERQGSVLTIQVREVCRQCNSGWMSHLETTARPVLERLWSSEKTLLTSAETATLARWAAKTAWMHERSMHEDPTPTPDQRHAVMDARPPVLMRVWAARHIGKINFGCPVARISTGHRAQGWNAAEKRHVMVAALVCHGLALLVRTDDGTGVPPLSLDTSLWLPVSPRQSRGRLAWPPRSVVNDEAIRWRMTHHRDWAVVPDVPYFERDTRGWIERLPAHGQPAPRPPATSGI